MNDETSVIEQDIDRLRRELSVVTAELLRRERALFDWRLQLRRHAFALVALLAASAASIAGIVLLLRRLRRR